MVRGSASRSSGFPGPLRDRRGAGDFWSGIEGRLAGLRSRSFLLCECHANGHRGELSALDKVNSALGAYDHPLVSFSARLGEDGVGVDVLIQLRDPSVSAHTYTIHLAPRDLDNPRFTWAFQDPVRFPA